MSNNTKPNLIQILEAQRDRAVDAKKRAHAEATRTYFDGVLATAKGGDSINPEAFEAAYTELGLELGDAVRDIEQVRSILAVETQLDSAGKALEAAQTAAAKASQEERAAKAAHDAADRAARQASGREGDAQRAVATAEAALKVARETAADLKRRGLHVELLRPAVVVPPRMARYVGQAPTHLCGSMRAPGDLFEVPRTAILEPVLTPLSPGDPGPQRQSWLVDAAQPWPIPVRRRRFRSGANFVDPVLGSHSINETFERDVPDDYPLPSHLSEQEPLPPVEKPAPAAAPVAAPTSTGAQREAATATLPVVDPLEALLGELEQEEPQ